MTLHRTIPLTALMCSLAAPIAHAHLIGDDAHDSAAPHYDFSIRPPGAITLRGAELRGDTVLLAQATRPVKAVAPAGLPPQAAAFQAFAPKVSVRADGQFLYVESDGMPAHNLMVGITAWQQQVPLPQPYMGANAWRVPLNPVPAKTPASIKNRFLRGAIALAANGIPIFNPQNNRGEVSADIGELDQWGGHCGRADDYHYHAAPLHLQAVLGKDQPIAYALDGYAIFGLTEPDGSAPAQLDAFNGHATPALGYHYHASLKYPYVNGGFHGEVVERDGQVDPQPRAGGVREALQQLRGARITGFTAKDGKAFSLKYEVGAETRFVNYTLLDADAVKFDFVDGRGQTRTETYSPRQRGPGGGERPPGEPKGKDGKKKGPAKGPPPPERAAKSDSPPFILNAKRSGNLVLSSAVVKEGGALPTEFTGDGAGISPPLEWRGAPTGTQSFAIVMDHLAPGNEMKCYWTLWNIPATTTSLPKNARDIGTLGAGFKGTPGYEPPHSQGPGEKRYTIHLYALSAAAQLPVTRTVTRDLLLAAIADLVQDSADLTVTYTRPGGAGTAKPR
ncbi:MAG: YHYH protein [Limisphaerales bacterium]